MSQPNQRRIGPAVAMVVAILGAAVLLVLAPFYMSGPWTEPQDPWERVSRSLLAPGGGPLVGPGPQISPESLVLLESDPDAGLYFYAGESKSGALIAGLVAADTSGHTISPRGDWAAAGFGLDSGPSYYIWVQRAPAAESGFRHRLVAFDSEAELRSYMDGLVERDDAPGR